MTPANHFKDPWVYACPACHAKIVADRFEHDKVICSACGAGPYEVEHECDAYDDGDCADRLMPWEE